MHAAIAAILLTALLGGVGADPALPVAPRDASDLEGLPPLRGNDHDDDPDDDEDDDDDRDADGREDDDDRGARAPDGRVAEYFENDPLLAPDTYLAGAALERLEWRRDAPAFPGDRRGSLTADYDASLPAGVIGFEIDRPYGAGDAFAAGAVFIIRSEGFAADPNGFFQISWGLFNRDTTGLNRTGNFDEFATDSFDLFEFDWFPNVSPSFGGPFLSPSAFGAPNPDSPSFGVLGAVANAAFAFGAESPLPFDEPLLATLEHRPGVDAVVVGVYRIVGRRRALPVPSAVTTIDLAGLSLREFRLDQLGITLWNDGFGGPEPALRAKVEFHALIARPGRLLHPEQLLGRRR